MAQCARHLPPHPLDQVGESVVGSCAHPQRRDGDQHSPGAAQHHCRPGRDRQVDEYLVAAGHARKIGTECRDDHRSGGGIEHVVGTGESTGRLVGQRRGHEGALRHRRSDDRRQTRARGHLGDPLGPVSVVGLEPVRRPISLIDRVQGSQICRAVGFGRTPLRRGCVQRGDPVHECHRPIPVERDVMNSAVPQIVLLADLQHRGPCQHIPPEVDRARVLTVHPRVSRPDRVVRGAEVDEFRGQLDGGIDHLERLTVHLEDPQEGGLELPPRRQRRLIQKLEVEGPVQFDVLGDAECDVGCQPLREPHPALRRRQGEGVHVESGMVEWHCRIQRKGSLRMRPGVVGRRRLMRGRGRGGPGFGVPIIAARTERRNVRVRLHPSQLGG
ncbi:hypothetical protein MLGJGCBP_03639 [Rhodococcus sp. T7]|nr:hypothetical protein MLGJGCBP_03639 [Rhodococcus sp. T7]